MSKSNKRRDPLKRKAYHAWRGILRRCNDPKNSHYIYYGARGIKVCERWAKFENFYCDMGKPEHGMSLDRIDNDGNYEPSNCRWATRQQQSLNKQNSRRITFNGVTKNASEWSKSTGFSINVLLDRLKSGWPVEIALTLPPAHTNSRLFK